MPALLPLPECFWHTTPLHYAPYLLHCGALYSQARLRAKGLPVQPRRTAAKRDRKLGLSDFVHLSLRPDTPLLAHKRAMGYPHVLLAFDRSVADLPGAAIIKYNHKAWRHRDDFAPLTGSEEKAEFWEAWQRGRYPSAELIVSGELLLSPPMRTVFTASDEETGWLRCLMEAFPPPVPGTAPLVTNAFLFPPGPTVNLSVFEDYAAACHQAGKLLPPPAEIPFD